jgi:hypothetical protein
MSKADISPTPIRSRRAVLAGIFAVAAVPIATAIPTATPAMSSAPARAHADAKLLELGIEYERRLAVEEPLKEESTRLWNVADRLRYEKLGIDPDNREACLAYVNDHHSEWMHARDVADEEVGYSKAWRKTDRASTQTARVGKKIFKIAPSTMAGLLVRIRVIETHDEIFDHDPAEQLLTEIREFSKRAGVLS